MGIACVALALVALAACARANLTDDEGDPLNLPDRVSDNDGGGDIPEDSATADNFVPLADGGGDGEGGAGGLKVFVSSTTHNARYGGLAGADKICNDLAKAAGVSGTFVAWLSNKDGPHAVNRVTSTGPWTLVGTTQVVAATKAELTSGTLKRAIDRDENGAAAAESSVWTGTGQNGMYETNDCDQWTTGNNGRSGQTDETDDDWTSNTVDDCDALHRVYCFQN